MEKKLYPLVFEPILKDKIWGGNKLKTELNKEKASDKCGESWELSGVKDNVSTVINGFLAGNSLEELIEIYMGELVGDSIYEKYGIEFPLLIKFIDANDKLSIQVHPNDQVAAERHDSFGKTEMWYVVDANPGAEMIVGFKKDTNKEEYVKSVEQNTLLDILNVEKVKKGDAYFIPAGRVHAIGDGILIAEIQQTSDITYRIYDYNRLENGKPRELHTEQALDVIDFKAEKEYKSKYGKAENAANLITNCNYFTTNYINLTQGLKKDYFKLDSFVIYMCMEGSFIISSTGNDNIVVSKGMTVLLPADINEVTLYPEGKAELLEVFIQGN